MGGIDYEYLFGGFRDSRVQNHTPAQAPTVSLRGLAQDLQNEREARVSRKYGEKNNTAKCTHSLLF